MLIKNANNARKTLTLGAIMTAISLALSGCGATGVESPTRNTRQVTDGVEGQVNGIKARNVLLVAQPDGSAVLVGTFINSENSSDAIASMSVNGITAKLDPAQNELIQNRPVIFAGPTATASASFPGLNAQSGTRLDLELNFVVGGPLKLNVLVVEKADVYASVG